MNDTERGFNALVAALAQNQAEQEDIERQLAALSTTGPGFRPASTGGRLRGRQEQLEIEARRLRKEISDEEMSG